MKNKIITYLSITIFFIAGTFAQNVGIGIANPLSKLHVVQTDTFNGVFVDHSGTFGSSIVLSPQNALNSSPTLLLKTILLDLEL